VKGQCLDPFCRAGGQLAQLRRHAARSHGVHSKRPAVGSGRGTRLVCCAGGQCT
jgi:hypothetical protein